MFDKAKEAFEKYIKNYNMAEKLVTVKYYHTYKVVELMEKLARRLNLSDEEIEIAKIIGLLHDIGRFEQLKEYKTLTDRVSMDHAEWGCVYLFDDGHIRDFIEEDKYDNLIYNAIYNHNKKEVNDDGVFTKMIRDMDKTDIFRVDASYFNYEFDASEVTPIVLEKFKNKELIDLSLAKSKSDSIIIICAFVFDYYFNESFDILAETDNFELFLSTVDVNKNSEKLWGKIKELSINKVNQGIK